jgi:hypothetical protein
MTTPTRGPVFGDVDINGDSSQNIVGTQVSGDVVQTMNKFVRGRPSMYLGSTEVADRVACYVPAHNHDLIVKALEVNRAITLSGPPGCGRETTAIAAIRQLRPGIAIRRFSLEDEDTEEIDAKGPCGYLVHAADGGLFRLGRCIDAVRAACGYLVVIADSERAQAPLVAYLPQMAVEPPHPVAVYQRRVTLRGLAEWPDWNGAPALLERALPAEARRLADLIEEIDGRGDDIATQRAEVAHAYQGWREELCGWFDHHREPHERALLIAAATLSPEAEATNVYSAASSLAQRLEITMNGGGLAWCPITGLRELLEAEPEGDRIVFRRHGYATSALRHALADYPLARSDLLVWLAALPTDDAVPNELRNPLAATFADLAAEHGTAGHIIDTARKWGEADLADLAFIALSRTCLHPRVGRLLRSALYDWSYAARTPQTLKLTVARVCETLGQTYPSLALTRLKHLATHGNRQVQNEVINVAQALLIWGHHAEVLAAALAWCADANSEKLSYSARQRRRRVGAMLFLELARPVTEEGLPAILRDDRYVDPVPGWRAALDLGTAAWSARDALEEVAWQWLDAALPHGHMRERIIRFFIEAATPSLDIPPRITHGVAPAAPDLTPAKIMIDLARRWAAANRTDPIRREIKEAIVIPLTKPWWLRLLKLLYVHMRTRLTAPGQPR